MATGIDAVERCLVCQLAQVGLQPIVHDFVSRWSIALENGSPLPDMLYILEAAAEENVPSLTIASLEPYLQQCAKDSRVPDPSRVITSIVHGFAEVRFPMDRTCRCPARQPLMEAPSLPSERLAFFDDD